MTIWFMYDNHLFAKYRGEAESGPLRDWIAAKFAEDKCGSVFARDARDNTVGHLYTLHSDGWALLPSDVDTFLATVEEHANWEARG